MTSATTTPAKRPIASRRARALVWIFGLLIVFGAAALADGLTTSTPPDVLFAADPATLAPAPRQTADRGTTAPCQPSTGNAKLDVVARNYCSNPEKLLPAYRWKSLGLDSGNESGGLFGWGSVDDNALNGIVGQLASIGFALQGLVWTVLTNLLSFALDFDVFSGGRGAAINDAFRKGANAILSGTGLFLLPVILAVFAAASAVLKGRRSSAMRGVFAAILPIAFLMALTAQANQAAGSATGTTAEGAENSTAGPLWLATTALDMTEEVSMLVGAPFRDTVLGQDGSESTGAMENDPTASDTMSCGNYTAALYEAFKSASNSDEEAGKLSLLMVSRMWETSTLNNWREAQLSDSVSSWYIYCHMLEDRANIDRAEQVNIGIAAGYPSVDTELTTLATLLLNSDIHDDIGDWLTSDNAMGGIFSPGSMELDGAGNPQSFAQADIPEYYQNPMISGRRDPYNAGQFLFSGTDAQASYMMWAACTNQGGRIMAREAWAQAGAIDGIHCKQWWTLGINPGEPDGGPLDIAPALDHWSGEGRASDPGNRKLAWDTLPGTGSVAGASDLDTKWYEVYDFGADANDGSPADNVNDVRDTVAALHGRNHGDRMMLSLVGTITTLGYAYLLGGLAVGALLAKLALALLIVMLPVTLFLLAFNYRDGRAMGSTAGGRLAKLTLAMLLASVVFNTVMVFMLYLSSIIRTLLGNPQGGLMGAVVPIMSLAILWWLMKTAGLGNAFKPMSLAAAPLAAGAWAAKDQKTSSAIRNRAAQGDKALAKTGRKAWDQGAGRIGMRMHERARNNPSTLNRAAAAATRDAAARRATEETKKRTMDSRIDRVNDQNEKHKSELETAREERRAARAARRAERLGAGKTMDTSTVAGQVGIAGATAAMFAGLRNKATRPPIDPAVDAGNLAGRRLAGARGKIPMSETARLTQTMRAEDASRLAAVPPNKRDEEIEKIAASRMENLRDAHSGLLNPDGTPMVDAEGRRVYGFTRVDENGNSVPVDPSKAGWDAKRGIATAEGVTAITEPQANLSVASAEAAANALAVQYGVAPEAFAVSRSGHETVVNPRISTPSDPVRIHAASTIEATAEMASHPINWVPNETKELLVSSGLSGDALNYAINRISVDSGWVDGNGHVLDLPSEVLNIDMSSPRGQEILQLHIEGKASPLDDVHAHVDRVVVDRAIAAAKIRDAALEGTTEYRVEVANEVAGQHASLTERAAIVVPRVAAVPELAVILQAATASNATHEVAMLEQRLASVQSDIVEYKTMDVDPSLAEVVITQIREKEAERDNLRVAIEKVRSEAVMPDQAQLEAAVEVVTSGGYVTSTVDQLLELQVALEQTVAADQALRAPGADVADVVANAHRSLVAADGDIPDLRGLSADQIVELVSRAISDVGSSVNYRPSGTAKKQNSAALVGQAMASVTSATQPPAAAG